MINPNPNHIRQKSLLPSNIILAMIDGETFDYDQVFVSAQPPTLIIPSQNESSEGLSDNDFPPPPSTLNTIPLMSPFSSKNLHHYDEIDTHTTVTTTVTKIVDPPKKKSKGAIFCLLLSAAIFSALVLLLVFGWHEKLSFGDN
uniref:Uncharacterized protein n=1 Tax=Panagrolaimus davidi TaxID=227884 RepID=A0A914QVA3_9BILA